MTSTSAPILLQAPTPAMLKDDSAHYRFLLGVYNRTGGSKGNSNNPKELSDIVAGLTTSVNELNTLEGMRIGDTVQGQLDNKVAGSIIRSNASPVIAPPTILVTSTICQNFTTHGNVGAVETDLGGFYLLANTLINDADFIEITCFGTFASNANNKRIKLEFGSTTLYDSTALSLNSGAWKIDCTIARISSASEKYVVTVNSGNLTLPKIIGYGTATENLATQLHIVFTGTGTSNNDIVQEGLIIKYYKA